MQVFESLAEARIAEKTNHFVEIRRITEEEWHAYETVEEIPPLPTQDNE